MTSLRQMLVLAGAQFTAYAQNHRLKAGRATDPAVVFDTTNKAEANEAMARRINESLREAAEFPEMVERLQKPGEDILEQVTPLQAATVHMAFALALEAGELGDPIKKWAFYGKHLDITNVIEELGDIEFYLEGLRQNLGITREMTLAANIDKLARGKDGQAPRYGDAYSDEAAILRADKRTEAADKRTEAADKRTEQADVEAWEEPWPTPLDTSQEAYPGAEAEFSAKSTAATVLGTEQARAVLNTTPSYFSDLATIPARERYIRLKALVPDATTQEELAVMVTNLEAAGVEMPR